jgi:hypothetical protein
MARTKKGMYTHFKGEEEREPAEHVFGDSILPVRVNTQSNVTIKNSFEITGQPAAMKE